MNYQYFKDGTDMKNENNGCLIAGIAKIEYKNEKGC